MANRRFSRQVLHLQPGTYSPVKVWLKFTGAATVSTGGFTINAGDEAVASVAYVSTGVITVTMKDTYKNLIGINTFVLGGVTFRVECTAEDVDGAKTITLNSYTRATDAAATALVDLDGEVAFVELTLEN